MTRENPPTNARGPITVLTVVLVMTWAVLAGLGWFSYSSYHKTEAATQRRSEIEELRGAIIHLDEVLTMSARMAAFTGDPQWENRYRRFEPQLDAAIKEAMRFAPQAYSGEAAAATDAANIKLIQMEKRAFDLVRQGRVEEATAVLFSDEYESQKQVYAEGMDAFTAGLADTVSTTLKREQRLSFLQTGAMLLLMPLLIVAWVVVFRAVYNWKTTLAKQAEELVEVNESLGQKVVERTEVLQNEVAERKRVEESLQKERDFAESLVDTAQAIILVLDTDGRIVRFNPYMEEISGYRSGEVQGKDWFDTFISNRDRERIRKLFLAAIGNIRTRGNVNCIVNKDGQEREIQWYDKTLKDGRGNTIGLLAIGQDVTEQKRAEEDREVLLRDTRERVKELTCLYKVARSIHQRDTLEEIFLDVAALIPPGWQYPEITRGRVTFEGRQYVVEPFEETEWKQASDIIVDGRQCGSVEVYYLQQRPELDAGPFMKEERQLIDGLAQILGEAIKRKRAEEQLVLKQA